MEHCLKETRTRIALLAAAAAVAWAAATQPVPAQSATAQNTPVQDAPASGSAAPAGPPPSSGGFYPLAEVHRGLTGTAWTVFEGSRPEPMQVEVLGLLRNALGPRQDLILARLHGAKAEYTGVVEGMSGSPVYIGSKLLGALSYRIGQFSKEPICGITPIQQMLEVRNLPVGDIDMARVQTADFTPAPANGKTNASATTAVSSGGMDFEPIETPLVMSGFSPQAVDLWQKLWQKQMNGTGLTPVAAGGIGGASSGESTTPNAQFSSKAAATVEPGSAISALLVRGDLEISGTCTVTYIDPKQLLACGHPILQAGTVSLPMTTADVVATLASPLNAFKIINTGATVGAFTEDRNSAIRGVLGASARMIPMHVAIAGYQEPPGARNSAGADDSTGSGGHRSLNVEILDLPSLTPQAMLVVLYQSLLQSNAATASMSYHLTGSIDLDGLPPVPLDLWSTPGELAPAPLQLAILAAQQFVALYSNGARQGAIRSVDLHVEEIPRRLSVELRSARLVSNDIVHSGDTVVVEATLQPWQQPARNVRIPVRLPRRLDSGNLRLLVSDGATLDRTLHQPQSAAARPASLSALLDEARSQHAADRIYVSLLVPEAQAGMDGDTLSSVPLSMANALEPARTEKDISLNGESAEPAVDVPAGGVLTGFQVLSLHIEPGGGLN